MLSAAITTPRSLPRFSLQHLDPDVDDGRRPVGPSGTSAAGISGNNVVGGYYVPAPPPRFSLQHRVHELHDAKRSVGGTLGTSAQGIDGNNVVGTITTP